MDFSNSDGGNISNSDSVNFSNSNVGNFLNSNNKNFHIMRKNLSNNLIFAINSGELVFLR